MQGRSPAVRARHGKRLPQLQGETITGDGDGNVPNLSFPITVTIVQTRQPSPTLPPTTSISPTVTVFVPPTTSIPVSTSSLLTSSTSLGSPLSQGITQSSSSATSTIQRPTPSASANNDGNKNETSGQSNASASREIPIGSIIGIIVAVVVVFLAAAVFLIRRRSVRNRLRMRGGWGNQGANGPSFLWIEPVEKSTPSQNRSGRSSPGDAFARAQSQALPYTTSKFPYIPPPAPPRPPLAYGTSDTDFGPSTPSALGLSIPAALVPGGRATPAPSAYSSPAPGGYGPSSESATVKSTFIPTLPDELSIATGEAVRIVSAYDDGWALCSNARGEIGMVPLECLDRAVASQAQQEGREYRNLSRVSSLAASSRPY